MNQLLSAVVDGRRVQSSEGGLLDLLKLRSGTTEAEARRRTERNGTDELLFRTEQGDLYLIQGDPLGQGPLNLCFPRRGQAVSVGALRGEVVYVDDERSHRTALTAMTALAALLAVGAAPATALLGVLAGVGWVPTSTLAWTFGVGATSATLSALGARVVAAHEERVASGRAALEPLVQARDPLARW